MLQTRRAEIGVSCHRPASTLKPPATTKAEGKEKFRSSGGTTDPFPTYNLSYLSNQTWTIAASPVGGEGPCAAFLWNHPSPRLLLPHPESNMWARWEQVPRTRSRSGRYRPDQLQPCLDTRLLPTCTRILLQRREEGKTIFGKV